MLEVDSRLKNRFFDAYYLVTTWLKLTLFLWVGTEEAPHNSFRTSIYLIVDTLANCMVSKDDFVLPIVMIDVTPK